MPKPETVIDGAVGCTGAGVGSVVGRTTPTASVASVDASRAARAEPGGASVRPEPAGAKLVTGRTTPARPETVDDASWEVDASRAARAEPGGARARAESCGADARAAPLTNEPHECSSSRTGVLAVSIAGDRLVCMRSGPVR
eukprot:scaffold97453_cov51-Phaeocystis_antarctica.AAC.3